MGAFYGSVHIRSEDVAALRRALEDIAAQGQTRFLVAPLSAGWISVYPSGHGQDVSVSAAIAARLPAPVLHLLLHDDDVFVYALYDSGGLIDEYCSDPDYFEPSPSARWQETAGRPEILAALTAGGDRGQLEQLLERDARTGDAFRAAGQMSGLARALGIATVETSYEDLREGETAGIAGWQQFVHIPDLSAEKEATRRRQAEVTATTRRLEREGCLLLTKKRAGGHARFPAHPVFCASPHDGFFVAWTDPGAADGALEWWRAPWHEPSDGGLRIGSRVHRMRASPSGRFLGVGHASGEWSAQVFDLREGKPVTTVPLPRAAEHICFTRDERTLIVRSQGELQLVATDEGHTTRSMALGGGRSATVHPDGQWLVADVQDGHSASLALVDVSGLRTVRRLETKANDLAAFMAAHAAGQPGPSGFHPCEIPNKVEFTADGRLLVVAVTEGIRVYAWEDVLRADTVLPPPLASADTDLVRMESGWMRHTYGFDVDRRRGAVLFPGLDGRVHALHLETGRATTVFETPGTPPAIELAVSDDGATLALVTYPGMFSRGRKRGPPVFQVWNLSMGPWELAKGV